MFAFSRRLNGHRSYCMITTDLSLLVVLGALRPKGFPRPYRWVVV